MRHRPRSLLLAVVVLAGCDRGTASTVTPTEPAAAPGGSCVVSGDAEIAKLEAKLEDARRALEDANGSDLPIYSPAALGFEPDDPYQTMGEACEAETARLVDEAGFEGQEAEYMTRVIARHCKRRSHHSSRDGRYRSAIDGTQIHDRDRPAAIVFWTRGVKAGYLDPRRCPAYRIDHAIPKPPAVYRMAQAWPFTASPLSEKRRRRWLKSPHDVERLGSRGPIDLNAQHLRFLSPCVDPALLERFDVAAYVHGRRALWVCARLCSCSYQKLRRNWSNPRQEACSND